VLTRVETPLTIQNQFSPCIMSAAPWDHYNRMHKNSGNLRDGNIWHFIAFWSIIVHFVSQSRSRSSNQCMTMYDYWLSIVCKRLQSLPRSVQTWQRMLSWGPCSEPWDRFLPFLRTLWTLEISKLRFGIFQGWRIGLVLFERILDLHRSFPFLGSSLDFFHNIGWGLILYICR